MKLIQEHGRAPIKAWVHEDEYGQPCIEQHALDQLRNIATLPFIHSNGVAVMPDVHAGIGATVGTVIATKGAIIPAAVGVDIGCGMMAVRLAGARAEHLPESLSQIRSEIEHTVPTGFDRHNPGTENMRAAEQLYRDFKWIEEKHPDIAKFRKDDTYTILASQFGSLGGGNHFIELCIDEAGELWVMLHSGSRGIGNLIGNYFINLAKEDMRVHMINLPDKDLAYLDEGTEHFDDYVKAVSWAQDYARKNRDDMMRRILIVLHRHLPPFREHEEAINCHHNYVNFENHFDELVCVTRKGAICASKGKMGIIPGSMGQRSYIVRGLGNAESYESCSHGAGRVMSRGEAKRRFTVEDLKAQTEGVECRKDAGVLDEIPGAYKNIDQVMENQKDLVEVVHTLKQVLCIKGA